MAADVKSFTMVHIVVKVELGQKYAKCCVGAVILAPCRASTPPQHWIVGLVGEGT